MLGAEINWLRWFVFLVLGLPFVVWLIATRNDTLRLVAVLWVMVFIQDVFVWRRYLVAIGVGPSLILTYAALLGLYIQRGRFPALGGVWGLWALFLLTAVGGAVIGSVGSNLVFRELADLQQYYVEGLLIFLLGAMALSDDREVIRFFRAFVLLVALPLSLFHGFELATGWRPSGVMEAGKGSELLHGAVFLNPNSLADFWAMTIPVTLLLLREPQSHWLRALTWVAAGGMAVSLILTGARGGLLFTFVMSAVALILGGFQPGRVVGVTFAGLVLVLVARFVGQALFPEAFGQTVEDFEREGFQSDRTRTWLIFLGIILENPLGLGLRVEHVEAVGRAHGTMLASAHNIYLDMGLEVGILGMLAFLALVGALAMRGVRAIRYSVDATQRRAALYSLLPTLGFLVGGLVEPIYHNGSKISHVFWLFAGVGASVSQRALEAARARARSVPPPVSVWAPSQRQVEHG